MSRIHAGSDHGHDLSLQPESEVTGVFLHRPSGGTFQVTEDSVPMRLIGHFGRFRAESASLKLRGRMAFSCESLSVANATGLGAVGRNPMEDFSSARVTYALDMASGSPHGLVWSLSASDELVTFVVPPVAQTQEVDSSAPRLLPIDVLTFRKAVAGRGATGGDEALQRTSRKMSE